MAWADSDDGLYMEAARRRFIVPILPMDFRDAGSNEAMAYSFDVAQRWTKRSVAALMRRINDLEQEQG